MPQAQSDADDVISLLEQQRGCDGAVHASAQSCGNPLSRHIRLASLTRVQACDEDVSLFDHPVHAVCQLVVGGIVEHRHRAD